GQQLVFKDDAPDINTSGASMPTLTVDETNFAVDASASFAGMFTVAHNSTDGGNGVVYSLNAVAGNSGLVDSLSGQNVVLSISGGIVYGKTAIGGDEVFRVTVDSNGLVTLNESRSVMHTPDSGPDQPTSLAGNLVTLTATITDTDNDSDSATV